MAVRPRGGDSQRQIALFCDSHQSHRTAGEGGELIHRQGAALIQDELEAKAPFGENSRHVAGPPDAGGLLVAAERQVEGTFRPIAGGGQPADGFHPGCQHALVVQGSPAVDAPVGDNAGEGGVSPVIFVSGRHNIEMGQAQHGLQIRPGAFPSVENAPGAAEFPFHRGMGFGENRRQAVRK